MTAITPNPQFKLQFLPAIPGSNAAASAAAAAASAAAAAASAAQTADKVFRSGDTMTGLLVLSGEPAVALGAATKQSVDAKVAKAGDTMTGNLIISKTTPTLILNKTVGVDAAAVQGLRNGLARWQVELGDTATETGGNAGSNFTVTRYNDTGTLSLGAALTILRGTGEAFLQSTLSLGAPPTTANHAVSKAYAEANFQPLDADLTSLAAATGVGATGIHYRRTANTWVPLTMGSGMVLDTVTNTLSSTGGSGGGNVSAVNSPAAGQLAQWVTGTTIQGLSTGVLVKAPQGRLTLQSGVPEMVTTQAGKTTIFYTPYVGNLVPIYDGTVITMTAFSELSVLTTDTTKSPAAIGANKVNDWFVWNDSGTLRLGHGPDWTDDTTRSAGTVLTTVQGLLFNSVSITNGPAASRGTYVGTTRSNGSNQLDWIFGGTLVAGVLAVWNMYNRVPVVSAIQDNTANWTYTTASFRQVRAAATNQISLVIGMPVAAVARALHIGSVSVTGPPLHSSIGLDSTTVDFSSMRLADVPVAAGALATLPSEYVGTPSAGYHTLYWLEAGGANATFYGSGFGKSGMTLQFVA